MTGNLLDALGGTDRAWMDRAACRGCRTINFFPLESEPSAPAVEVCQRCEVSADCLAYALNNRIVEGIWGGTTEGERRRMLRMRPRKPAA